MDKKSLGVMNYEPPYTRPAWFILSKVEGYGGMRGAFRHLMAEPSTRLQAVLFLIIMESAFRN